MTFQEDCERPTVIIIGRKVKLVNIHQLTPFYRHLVLQP